MNNIYRGMRVFKANFPHDIYIYILAKSDTNNLRSLSYLKIVLLSIEKYSHGGKNGKHELSSLVKSLSYHHPQPVGLGLIHTQVQRGNTCLLSTLSKTWSPHQPWQPGQIFFFLILILIKKKKINIKKVLQMKQLPCIKQYVLG